MHRVVVIGDSAMWGQGLRQQQKYVFKYVEELKRQGFKYHLDSHDFLAHSGAIIGDLSTSEPLTSEGLPSILAASNRLDYSVYAPEVPTDYPSIYKQVSDVTNPKSVKLLIFNGGINDINMQSAAELDAEKFKKLVYKNIEQVSRTRFFKFLNKINITFSNARIVFVGYYPALSTKSGLPAIDYKMNLDIVFNQYFDMKVPHYFLALRKWQDIKQQALELSQGFLLHSSLQIARFNSLKNANILYCPSGFQEENAIYANGESYVFAPQDSTDTAVTNGRKFYCGLEYEFSARHINDSLLGLDYQALIDEDLAYLMCSQANLLHPNTAGSNKYVRQMHKIVTPLIGEFSLKQTLGQMTKREHSIRKVTSKFKRKPIKSVLELLDMRLISTIIVQFDFILQVAWSDFNFAEAVDFDFGWGKTRIAIPYLGGRASNFRRLGVLDLGGRRLINEINKLQIYLPLFQDSLEFKLHLKLFANGYEMAEGFLEKDSFIRQGSRMTWKTMIV